MNQIKQVSTLPNLEWLEHSKAEMLMTGQAIVAESDYIYQIGNVAVAGFIYSSLLGDPWMWFVLTKGVSVGDLVDFRRCAAYIPPRTYTGIREDYVMGRKFALLYGFEATGKIFNHGELIYEVFRRP